MGTVREVMHKKQRNITSLEMPAWLFQAQTLPNRNFITGSEKILIDLIRKYGELSKADFTHHTDFSRSKITTCVESLIDKKILIENKATEYSGGRRSKTFSLNGKAGLLAGMDIGATSIDLGVADFSGRILVRHSEPASVKDGPVKILGRACTMLERMLNENDLNQAKLNGIGIGVPGPVDFSAGTLVSPPIMPGWDRYPIIQMIQQWFPSANVVVDNDVNVMALGEINQGAGKGVDNLIFVKIGTGIGAGIICEGNIYRGSSGCAGDIGHISVNKTGPLCHCPGAIVATGVAWKPLPVDRQLPSGL